MARAWSIPTLAKRVEQFIADRGLPDDATIDDLRSQFKEAVWDAAIADDEPKPKPATGGKKK
jgi:hypothetical protein